MLWKRFALSRGCPYLSIEMWGTQRLRMRPFTEFGEEVCVTYRTETKGFIPVISLSHISLIQFAEELNVRIEKVEIQNLRCIKSSVAEFDPYTCFVGPNGAGKSTVLCALNIFFRNLESAPTDLATLTKEDFHLQDTSKPVEVRVTFGDLSEDAKKDLQDYVRQDRLVVTASATFNTATGKADVKQFGERLGMAQFAPFFEAYGDEKPVSLLKSLFEELLNNNPDLAKANIKTTKEAMKEGLKAYEANRPEECTLLRSEDQFYGVSGGKDRLSKYVQWIYVPAVKDVSEEQNATKTSALGKLLARTVNAQTNFKTRLEEITNEARAKYQQMLDENQTALEGISTTLGVRLASWSHPNAKVKVVWEQEPLSAVKVSAPTAGIIAGESGFEGKIARLGHGLQRSLLLALLQELAILDDKSSPTLILGCEEPELYQHPPQARYLASVFEQLASASAQIIITTHSPYFVSGEHFESIRLVRRNTDDDCARIRQFTLAAFAVRFGQATGKPVRNISAAQAKLHQALQPALSEMFFTEKLVLVEGLEDISYIQSWMAATNRLDDFRSSRVHIVPVQGKSELIRPTIIALGLEIPVLVVMDADGDKLLKLDKKTNQKVDSPEARADHTRDNRALARLMGEDETELFPAGVVWGANLVIWPSDLADIVKREFIVSLGAQGSERFAAIEQQARDDAGNAGDLGKNSMYIGYLLSHLHDANASSHSLDNLCEHILQFANAKSPNSAATVC
jgi:putative ATP-dependent endonuclease of the OLD family